MPAAALTATQSDARLAALPPSERDVDADAIPGPRPGAWAAAQPGRLRVQPTGSGRALLLVSLLLLGLNWGLQGNVGAPAATGIALWLVTGVAARRNLVALELSIRGHCIARAGERAALGVRWRAQRRRSLGRDWELLWLEPDDSGRRHERVVARCAWARVRPGLHPDGAVESEVQRLFARRGRWREQQLRLRSLFPLGLWIAEREWSAAVDYRATPRPGRLTGAWRWPAAGPRRGLRRPRSGADEFRGLRPLKPGESLQRVRWKLAARHPEWQVGEWCEPRAPELALHFDPRPARRRSAGWDSAFERGVSCLLTVAARAVRDGRRVRVIWAGGPTWILRQGWDLERLAWHLSEAQPEEPDGPPNGGPGDSGAANAAVLRLHFGRPWSEVPEGAVQLDVLSEEFERVFQAPGSLRAGGRL
ncbi:MAG: DUF58 domain-containing protein [Planctomycetota bacterium]|jgi:hypothetical protein